MAREKTLPKGCYKQKGSPYVYFAFRLEKGGHRFKTPTGITFPQAQKDLEALRQKLAELQIDAKAGRLRPYGKKRNPGDGSDYAQSFNLTLDEAIAQYESQVVRLREVEEIQQTIRLEIERLLKVIHQKLRAK
jgi:hypothetical protein